MEVAADAVAERPTVRADGGRRGFAAERRQRRGRRARRLLLLGLAVGLLALACRAGQRALLLQLKLQLALLLGGLLWSNLLGLERAWDAQGLLSGRLHGHVGREVARQGSRVPGPAGARPGRRQRQRQVHQPWAMGCSCCSSPRLWSTHHRAVVPT